MKLITTGCSFAGWAPTGNDTWPVCLSKRLNLKSHQVLSMGLGGCSLDYIYRSVIHGVIDNLNQDLVVVVGWTSINRWEKFTDEFGNFNGGGTEPHQHASQYWVSDYRDDSKYKQHLLNYSRFQEHMRKLHLIIMLAGFLKSHNIKYLFFNAFDPLDGWKKGTGYCEKSETGENCPVLNKLTDYVIENVNFLEQTQIEIGAKEGCVEKVRNGDFDGEDKSYPYTKKEYYSDDGWHLSGLGHKEWSGIVYDFLKQKYGVV
jgi:hypothetical protein